MKSARIKKTSQKGFTLIELLIVVAIIAALAIAIFVTLNPAKRLLDTRNARRTSDVDTILIAIHQYIIDNKGIYPTGLSAGMAETQIGNGGASGCTLSTPAGCNTTSVGGACVDLSAPLASYLKRLPIDPIGGTTYTAAKTGYDVTITVAGIVTVNACAAEGTPVASISASR